MRTLEERLEQAIVRLGENSNVAGVLRKQIAANNSGQSLQEMYLTGSYKKASAKEIIGRSI